MSNTAHKFQFIEATVVIGAIDCIESQINDIFLNRHFQVDF